MRTRRDFLVLLRVVELSAYPNEQIGVRPQNSEKRILLSPKAGRLAVFTFGGNSRASPLFTPPSVLVAAILEFG